MSDSETTGKGVQEEFLAEAQEIIEALSRDLLLLDQGQKGGRVDPELINEVFRGVHTLKGIAGMFGYAQVGAVAHALEDLLDDLRLGRVDISQNVLDVLFEGVENVQRLLAEGANEAVDLDEYSKAIDDVVADRNSMQPPVTFYDLEPSVLDVLTEYEEHRLRTNAEQGMPLFRLKVRFSLTSIDSELEELKARAKPHAEIITYLPSMEGSDGDSIDLDVLLVSQSKIEDLQELLCGPDATMVQVARRQSFAPVAGSNRASLRASLKPDVTSRPAANKSVRPRSGPASGSASPARAPIVERSAMTADQLSLRSLANTVRVDIRKLDHLMNVVGELAIVRNAVARLTDRVRSRPELRALAIEMHRVNRGFERHLEELQNGILDVRMVPLGQIFDKLARVVRQVAREHDKKIRLVVTGADTEVDKLIVEELSDPLMHIIRNAIDHGIEKPKVRELGGKDATGSLALNAYQKGNRVVIEIEDDGAGMNERLLLESAVRKGLVSQSASSELSRDDVFGLIFMAGFSTRSAITDLSGRGVGMDVVKTNISRLGGIVDVQSELGVGSKFTITLPITLAIISTLVVEVARRVYCVPLTSVQEAIALDPAAVRTVEGREVISLRGNTLPLCRLQNLFDLPEPDQGAKQFVVVSGIGQRRVGFVVDLLHGQQDIVIKPLGKSLASVRGFAGATDLGDQKVSLVLDAPALLEEVLATSERALTAGALA